MNFKRSGKTIFGISLSPAEQKVLDRAIEDQLAESLRKRDLEIEARVLYAIRSITGYDEADLRRVYDDVDESLEELAEHYEMHDDDDLTWLCIKKLKDDGIDIEQWSKENEAKRKAKEKGVI